MEPHDKLPPKPESLEKTDVISAAPQPGAAITTRDRLPGSRLGEKHAILSGEQRVAKDLDGSGLVTRRYTLQRKERRKRVLKVLAGLFALFPPVWPIYMILWLSWRTRPPQKSMRQVRKGIKALDKGYTGVALKHFQEAHYLNPSNNDALYWLGLLLVSQNRFEEAAEALSLVSERVPGLPEVETALVDAYVATNEPEGAIYHAQRLLEIAPYESETLLKLADAYEAAGKFDLAIKALEQAPLHKRVLSDALVQIHYRLGLLYERQGQTEKALHHFNLVYARDITYKDIRSRVQKLEAGSA